MFGIYVAIAIECMIGTSARTVCVRACGFVDFWCQEFPQESADHVRRSGDLLCRSALHDRQVFGPLQYNHNLQAGQFRDDPNRGLGLGDQVRQEHPFGGGFGLFNGAIVDFKTEDANGQITTARRVGTAAHSIYFEVLGEQGYPGIFLFLLGIVTTMFGTHRISRIPHDKKKPLCTSRSRVAYLSA
jgi:hypothetical protein